MQISKPLQQVNCSIANLSAWKSIDDTAFRSCRYLSRKLIFCYIYFYCAWDPDNLKPVQSKNNNLFLLQNSANASKYFTEMKALHEKLNFFCKITNILLFIRAAKISIIHQTIFWKFKNYTLNAIVHVLYIRFWFIRNILMSVYNSTCDLTFISVGLPKGCSILWYKNI